MYFWVRDERKEQQHSLVLFNFLQQSSTLATSSPWKRTCWNRANYCWAFQPGGGNWMAENWNVHWKKPNNIKCALLANQVVNIRIMFHGHPFLHTHIVPPHVRVCERHKRWVFCVCVGTTWIHVTIVCGCTSGTCHLRLSMYHYS